MQKRSLFIGSSSEGLEVARALEYQLQHDTEVTIWKDGVFGLSLGTLESLVSALERFDFAILVLTPDDLVITREITAQTPRDNVMFELGLFMGRLGRTRCFIVCSNDKNMRLPSDLAGVSIARYEANRSDGNLLAALGPAATLIRQAIREKGSIGTTLGEPKSLTSSAQEKLTRHKERWTLKSGLIHGHDIYFNEITEVLGDYVIEFVEVTFGYQYSFVENAEAVSAEVNFRYKAADTPSNHSWHELLQHTFIPSKKVWRPVRFSIRHHDISLAWINFTLIHRGQTLRIRNLTTKY